MTPSKVPLTNAEVPAVKEILRLKINPLSPLARGVVSDSVRKICQDEEKKGHPRLRDSTGKWDESALKDFLRDTASGLSADEQLYLTQIGDAEKERIYGAVDDEWSKRDRALKHHASYNEPKHKQNTNYTNSPNGPRHEHSPPRSHHYQTGDSSTATNFQSPYGQSGNNYGRPINNQPAYNSAIYGGGLANAGAPLQSSDYSYPAPTTHSNYHAGAPSQSLGYPCAAPALTPYSNYHASAPLQSLGYPYPAPAPTPHSGYHAGPSDREGERRSTRPTETSGYTSPKSTPKGPRDPGGRDVYF
ncbi:hypothetical protein JMJ35_001625 [Cladonia borealis]|uniref:Uncharacterized protein n=1 Tax=Cladonia borealis TaxID=184061 RepID=A0AA39UDK1_9LECA|nr:hypothetical protein JMJ35_001625 [Cladonia borealis]